MSSVDFTDIAEPAPPRTFRLVGVITLGVVGMSMLAGVGFMVFGEKFMSDITLPFQALLLAGLSYYGWHLIKQNGHYLPRVQAFAKKNDWSIRFDDMLADKRLLPPDQRDKPVVTPVKYVIQGTVNDIPFVLYPIEIRPRKYEPRFAFRYRTILRLDTHIPASAEADQSISTQHEAGSTFIVLHHTAVYRPDFEKLFAAAQA